MVRLMQGGTTGIPLQIWCFTSTTNWDAYEGIQSEILEHISAVAGDFDGLTIYATNAIELSNPNKP